MAEKVTLTVPVSDYAVSALSLRFKEGRITIELENTNGDRLIHTIEDPAATTLMLALNKADLSSNSLHRRIFARLITDGVLTGTISGVPD